MGASEAGREPVTGAGWVTPLLCLAGGGSLLGLSTNLAKLAGDIGLSPLAFLLWSIIGAAGILLTISIARGDPPPVDSRSIEYYAVAAFVSVAASNLIFFSTIPRVGAGFVAMIIALPPLLTYLGALVFGIERFRTVRAVGVAAALGGAGLLAARKFSAPDADAFWILLALAGPVLLAIGNLYRTLRWPEGVSAEALAPGMLIAGALLLAPAAMVPGLSATVALDEALPLVLIAVQAVVFAGQFLLLFALQKTGGPVLLSLLGSIGALVGVPIAVFLQGESPPEGLLPGATLIAVGVALVTWGGTRTTPAGARKS